LSDKKRSIWKELIVFESAFILIAIMLAVFVTVNESKNIGIPESIFLSFFAIFFLSVITVNQLRHLSLKKYLLGKKDYIGTPVRSIENYQRYRILASYKEDGYIFLILRKLIDGSSEEKPEKNTIFYIEEVQKLLKNINSLNDLAEGNIIYKEKKVIDEEIITVS